LSKIGSSGAATRGLDVWALGDQPLKVVAPDQEEVVVAYGEVRERARAPADELD
jgi:hypothetical protein